jgi:hypothetical protein
MDILSGKPGLADFLTAPLPCILCGRRPYVACVFRPRDQARAGAPPGQGRLIRYSLCRKCRRKPDSTRRAEAVIFADLDAMNRVN